MWLKTQGNSGGGGEDKKYKYGYGTFTWGSGPFIIPTSGKVVAFYAENTGSAGVMLMFNQSTNTVDYYYNRSKNSTFNCTVTENSFTVNRSPDPYGGKWYVYYVYESND